MRILVSWIGDDGLAAPGAEWLGFFQDGTVPVVGDCYIEPFGGGEMSVARVIERYTYLDENDEEIWHLFLMAVDIPIDRMRAFQLRSIEGEGT